MASIISAGTTSNTALNLSADTTGILQLASNGSTTALTIDTSQNVGIGTNSPATKLVVKGTHQSGQGIINIIADSGTRYSTLSFTNNTTQKGIVFHDNTDSMLDVYGAAGQGLRFTTNDAERMRITSGGIVLAGTSTAPAGNSVQMVLSNSVGAGIQLNNSTSSAGGAINASGGSGLVFYGYTGAVGSESYTERMRIDSSGNVSIGTTTPGYLGNPTDLCQIAVNRVPSSGVITNSARSAAFINLDGSSGGSSIQFATAAANNTNPTERMRIDSGGQVGIGTSSPQTKFHVSGGTIRNSGTNGVLQIMDGNTSGGVKIGAYVAALNNDGYLAFEGYNKEYGRFTANGDFLVNSTTNGATGLSDGYIKANMNDASRNGIVVDGLTQNYSAVAVRKSTTTGTSYPLYVVNSAGTYVGAISMTNTAVSYDTASDYRLKENIAPMTGALSKVVQLKPVTYTWKSDGSAGQGFIAHELQAVVPDCVTGEKDAVDEQGNPRYQGVDTSFLVATLTAAIQELKAELDATKTEVAALKGVN